MMVSAYSSSALFTMAMVLCPLPGTAASAVVIDLTQRTGAYETTGERLESSQVADNPVVSADVFASDDDTAAAPIFRTTLTIGGDAAAGFPDLRVTPSAMGINSAQRNSADTTTFLDETAEGVTPETLNFTFTTDLSITRIGLTGLDSHETGGETFQETLSITVDDKTITFAADSPAITAGQTIAGDADVSVLVLPEPITLTAGQSIKFGVANDGDGSLAGSDRSAFGLHSIEVVVPASDPEPN